MKFFRSVFGVDAGGNLYQSIPTKKPEVFLYTLLVVMGVLFFVNHVRADQDFIDTPSDVVHSDAGIIHPTLSDIEDFDEVYSGDVVQDVEDSDNSSVALSNKKPSVINLTEEQKKKYFQI